VWELSENPNLEKLLSWCREFGAVQDLTWLEAQPDCEAYVRVTFGETSAAQNALLSLHGMQLDGKVCLTHGVGLFALKELLGLVVWVPICFTCSLPFALSYVLSSI
jgi:hypothetical protein